MKLTLTLEMRPCKKSLFLPSNTEVMAAVQTFLNGLDVAVWRGYDTSYTHICCCTINSFVGNDQLSYLEAQGGR